MYIKSFRIKNIACFEDQNFHFVHDTGEQCRWIVLLGENGTGKSTLLQLLGLSLLGPDMIYRVSDYDWGDFVRRGQRDGKIEVTLEKTKSDEPKFTRRTDLSVAPHNTGVTIIPTL